LATSIQWTQVSATGVCDSGTAYSEVVQFMANVTGGTTPYLFYWNFGDGSPTSTLSDPTHTYTSAPNVATLTVSDARRGFVNTSTLIPSVEATCVTQEQGFSQFWPIYVLSLGVASGCIVGLLSTREKRR
jgi:PKD repeat protein